MSHPNLIPVEINGPEDLYDLAQSMKELCNRKPIEIAPIYSKTEKEALKKADEVAETVIESGHLRLLVINGQVVTIILTLDKFAKRWNLSMSIPSSTGAQICRRVDDKTATTIVGVFLGDGHEEIPPEGAFKGVRQFVLPLKGDENGSGQ